MVRSFEKHICRPDDMSPSLTHPPTYTPDRLGSENEKDHKLIFIWALPRTRSTILLRALTNTSDTEGLFEPYWYAHNTGPERRVSAMIGTFVKEVDEKLTYTYVYDMIHEKIRTHNVVVKDFPLSVVPTVNDLQGKYDAVPRGAKHLFLIRDPAMVIESWHILFANHVIEPWVADACRRGAEELGHDDHRAFAALAKYYFYLKRMNEDTMIIDTKDLAERPKAVLSKICDFTGLEYGEHMMSWDSRKDFPANWYCPPTFLELNPYFHSCDVALQSCEFRVSEDRTGDTSDFEEHELNMVQLARPYFLQLKALAHFF